MSSRMKFYFTGSSAPFEKVGVSESLCGRGFITITGEDSEYMSMINIDQDTAIEFARSILQVVEKIKSSEVVKETEYSKP